MPTQANLYDKKLNEMKLEADNFDKQSVQSQQMLNLDYRACGKHALGEIDNSRNSPDFIKL